MKGGTPRRPVQPASRSARTAQWTIGGPGRQDGRGPKRTIPAAWVFSETTHIFLLGAKLSPEDAVSIAASKPNNAEIPALSPPNEEITMTLKYALCGLALAAFATPALAADEFYVVQDSCDAEVLRRGAEADG